MSVIKMASSTLAADFAHRGEQVEEAIRELGTRPGVMLNPATALASRDQLRRA